ncbi:MAG: ABC transporter permease subunit [Ancalomicrobiaceae bacterium]|nr:ABC transporter permease subunit [Ancalomicrobiaceae bacterium]
MTAIAAAATVAKPARRLSSTTLALIGVTPFFVFALMFLIFPTIILVFGAFVDQSGNPTLNNIYKIFQNPTLVDAYVVSLKVSLITAVGGAILGLALAQAIVLGNLPRWMRPAVSTFCGVASNFAGVPLAFAFIASIGPRGLLTLWLSDYLGISLRALGFSVISFWGVVLAYLFFEIPLMVLIIAPALDGLKREWREAATTLGATSLDYWRHIGLPVLWPSLVGSTVLLFANSFGAIATAYALAGPGFNIITIQLNNQIRGDVLHDQNLGYAIALGMIVITGVSNGLYIWLRERGERWTR